MFRLRRNAKHFSALAAVAAGLLAIIVTVPTTLQAAGGKKKTVAVPATNLGDQRTTGHFDVSKIIWPNPPAITRIKFLDLFAGEKIDESVYAKQQKKKGWMDRLAGTQNVQDIKVDTLPFQLIRTYGVAVDSTGKVYAADQGVGAIFIFDPEHKEKVELIGNGRQANFGMITGLAMDDNDRLFVSDAKLDHIVVFNSKHEQEGVFGAGQLVRPGGMAIDADNRLLYVADTGNDVIDVYDADKLKLVRQIGKPSKKHDQSDPGLFSLPEAVAVDHDGNVYVTDTFNDRVEIFDADGNFISTFGENGDGPANFERPKGIAVDGDGHIWVVDGAQNRVKVFNREGRLLIYFGQAGHYPGQFMSPWGITIDKFNRVIVSETFPGRVQIFRYVTDAEAAQLKKERDGDEGEGNAPAAKQNNADANANGAGAKDAMAKQSAVGSKLDKPQTPPKQ